MPSTPSLRQAFLRFRRQASTSLLLVAALGLTLGAVLCATAFTQLVISRPLPYPQQDRLVVAEQHINDSGDNARSRAFSYPAMALLHDAPASPLALTVMLDHARDVIVSHPAQPLSNITYATGGYASLFAPPMALGRFPDMGNARDRTRPVAVISHAAWQVLFGMRGDVLGQHVRTAAGLQFEVVGVTARDFFEPELHGPGHRTDVWLPWAFNPSPAQWGWSATTDTLALVGRLAPGTDAQQAARRWSEQLETRWRAELGAASDAHSGWSTRVGVTDARAAIAGTGAEAGPLLLVATLGLVLVTLANVTHLLVARAAQRAREFSIRLALGARRPHLFGVILADTALLMVPAGVLAVAVAAAGVSLMQHMLRGMLTRLDELSIGWSTLAAAAGSTLALALLLSGLALASIGQPAAHGALNSGRQSTVSKLSRRMRAGLMASQIGVAALIIAVTVGLFRDAVRILDEDGIDLQRSTSAFLYPLASASNGAPPRERQFAEVRGRIANLPGVEHISQSHSPLQAFIPTVVVSDRKAIQYPVGLKRIDHAYLAITDQRLALGRNILAADIREGANVALVNKAFAERLRRDGGVLGRTLVRGDGAPHTIIGVVDEKAYPGVAASDARVYLPASEAGNNFILRFRPGAQMSREVFVKMVAAVDPGLGVFLYDDLEQQRSAMLLPRRITAAATLLVALLVFIVTGIGLHGMVSYTTRLIRTEIGARRAFGARTHHVLAKVAGSNLAAVACGCALGAALLTGSAAMPWTSDHGLQVRWADAAATMASLAGLAMLACWLSTRPLLSQSPASALRDAER